MEAIEAASRWDFSTLGYDMIPPLPASEGEGLPEQFGCKFPAGTSTRMVHMLGTRESKADLVRLAVERELCRREALAKRERVRLGAGQLFLPMAHAEG
jgi:hypothetical protein